LDGAHVQVKVLEQIPEDRETVEAWNNLVFRMERPEVFFTHQWALAASLAFSDSLTPLTFLIYESGRLTGVAALATQRESPDTVFFLGANTADYCDVLSEPENRGNVLATVFEEMNKRKLPNLTLANVPSESYTLQSLRAIALAQGFHLHQRKGYDCGIISLADPGQRQTVLNSVTRKEKERRGLKKLGQLGPVRTTHLSGEELENGLRPIFSAHISRFLATNRFSPLIRPQRRLFLTELGKLLSSAGWLKVSQLEVNGEAIAWNYGFRFSESWFWYLPTFQIRLEEATPGSCLLRLLTEEACADDSVTRLDLGLGEEAYKHRFANAVQSTRYLQLSKSMSRHLTVSGRHWLASIVGRSPVIDKRIRGARELLRRLQRRTGESGTTGMLKHGLMRARRSVVSKDEVAFFESPLIQVPESERVLLLPLSWEQLADAAIENADDEQTMQYLMRCGQRLRRGGTRGYCFQEREGKASHFLWVHRYDGFHLSEIDSALQSSDDGAVMIFDCWTPLEQRGRGSYATAIRLAAASLQREDKRVWIFSATANEASVRGILKAGFTYRFSQVRSRILFRSKLSHRERSPLG
jgi:CelD/BcsL family acetyltransferase involved in cellulose biosynthesis